MLIIIITSTLCLALLTVIYYAYQHHKVISSTNSPHQSGTSTSIINRGKAYKCSYCEHDVINNEFIKYYCEPSELVPKLIIRPNIRYIVTHELSMYKLIDSELSDEHIMPKLIHDKSYPIRFNINVFKQIGLTYLFNPYATSMFKLTTEYLPYSTVSQIYSEITTNINSRAQTHELITKITRQYFINLYILLMHNILPIDSFNTNNLLYDEVNDKLYFVDCQKWGQIVWKRTNVNEVFQWFICHELCKFIPEQFSLLSFIRLCTSHLECIRPNDHDYVYYRDFMFSIEHQCKLIKSNREFILLMLQCGPEYVQALNRISNYIIDGENEHHESVMKILTELEVLNGYPYRLYSQLINELPNKFMDDISMIINHMPKPPSSKLMYITDHLVLCRNKSVAYAGNRCSKRHVMTLNYIPLEIYDDKYTYKLDDSCLYYDADHRELVQHVFLYHTSLNKLIRWYKNHK